MTAEELKYSILSAAFSGKLTQGKKYNLESTVKEVIPDIYDIDIPEEWHWSTLGECCEMYTGNSIPESVKKKKYAGLEEGYDYIATKDVLFSHEIVYDNGVRIPYDEGFKVAHKGSVLMCIEGGSAGRKIGMIDRDVCFGNKLCVFFSTSVLNEYIYYYLQSYQFKAHFSGNISGIIGGVSQKKLSSTPIPIPSFDEQKDIVKGIKDIIPYIDSYREINDRLDNLKENFPKELRKAVLQYAVQGKLVPQDENEGTADDVMERISIKRKQFLSEGKIKANKSLPEISEEDEPFEIPSSWRWVRLIDILLDKPSNGYSPSAVKYETKYKNITLTATTSGFFKENEFKYIDIDEDTANRYWLKHNDILIQRSNSRELVGTSCIYRGEDNQFLYPDLIMRCRVYEEIDLKYIEYVLKSPLVKNYYSLNASGTSESMPKINQTIVCMTPVPIPPLKEQKRIVAKIEELLPYCDQLVKQ